MRSGFNLRNSVAHKRACLCLYRNLLKQCRLLPDHTTTTTPPSTLSATTTTNAVSTSSTIHDLIRTRFQRNKTFTSQHAITTSLSAGRRAQNLLASAASGSSSTTLIQLTAIAHSHAQSTETIQMLKAHYASQRKPPRPGKLKKIAHLENTRSKYWAQRVPNPIPILQRPVPQSELPDPTRPRKVPDLIAAQGIPFLRYKTGPQSPELSRIIRQYNAQDQRRWDLLARLVEEIDLAVLEDQWDRIIAGVAGVGVEEDVSQEEEEEEEEEEGRRWSFRYGYGNENENSSDIVLGRELPRVRAGSWAAELKVQLKETQSKIAAVSVKRRAMSQKMWDIVVREKELAEQEKIQRREKRRKQREEEEDEETMMQAAVNTGGER